MSGRGMLNYCCFLAIMLLTATSCGQKPGDPNNIELQNEDQRNYSMERIVNNLSNPWGMTWLPDGSMLITEKSGEIIRFENGNKSRIENLPDIYVRGQGGLLDIELHPEYEKNGWIYLTYASQDGPGQGGNTTLARARLENNALTDLEVLYKANPNSSRGQHFGSRIEFDKDGYVYFSVGDRGNRDVNPQDITRDCGKIYRLHDDGRIPEDNPFVGQSNAKEAIYTFGNRNVQGIAIHPETGELWMHEHGPKGGDEVNIIRKGVNYGWPVISYGINYSGTKFTDETSRPGMEQPIYYWVPSIAPCGMAFVTSDRYPDWNGHLLVGSLKFNYVELLKLKGNEVISREKLFTDIGRVRNVKMSPDGYIHVAVEGVGIYKIVPKK